MRTVTRSPLASDWNRRRRDYDIVVIGSGYGGAVTAARLASARWPRARPSICLLERGREWLPGDFPTSLLGMAKQVRNARHPLGLYELHLRADIGAVVGSGLGGTSLINGNVAAEPDPEVFENPRWPKAVRDARRQCHLSKHFARARVMLGATPHPHALALSKVQAMRRGAENTPDLDFRLHDLAVNFQLDGPNRWGVSQQRCINCGDCGAGCNAGAKNSLDTNYLPLAQSAGAHIFTQIEVRHLEHRSDGGYLVHYLRHPDPRTAGAELESGTLLARQMVVLAAGCLNSTAILLRSRNHGLSLPDTLGTGYSANGDFFGIAYNTTQRTNVLGWGADSGGRRARRLQRDSGGVLNPGPTTVSRLRYGAGKPLRERFDVEDWSIPSPYVSIVRTTLASSTSDDRDAQAAMRRVCDLGALGPAQRGALNHTLIYVMSGHDEACGTVTLDPRTDQPTIHWPQRQELDGFDAQNAVVLSQVRTLGGTFVDNPLWASHPSRPLFTLHPLGGCPMGEDHRVGAVDHFGQVYDAHGGLHDGIYVADAAVIPTSLGVKPLLTITALAEWRAEHLIAQLGGASAADLPPGPTPSSAFSSGGNG